MCGINGFISLKQQDKSKLKSEITLMNDLIIHRGPDDHGDYIDINEAYSIAMGMRRLSIIDLSTGHQPMFSEDKEIVIVFNGEIYNYRILKKELEDLGIQFSTTSDTEVILRLYEQFGPKAFHKLDGMFGFSIYDKKKQKVYIARDFFGEKPLYYTKQNDKFIWASELKSLIKSIETTPNISKTGLNLYFRLTYIPAPYSIYEGVHKLSPNHMLTYDLTAQEFVIEPIEESEPAETHATVSKAEATIAVRDLVEESVQSRSISDVPIGTFLSGGVDSSIVSLCLAKSSDAKINTFSIGFEKKSYDETDKAKTVSKLINSNHHEFILSEKDLENNIDTILLNFDEPFADSSSLPTYIVANKTVEHVKVALTGDGGDEVFGGYNKYHMGNINTKYTSLVPKGIHTLIKNGSKPFLHSNDDKRGKRFRLQKILNAIDYSGNYYWDIISLGYPSDTLSTYLLPDRLLEDPFEHYKKITKIASPKNLTEYRCIDKHISLEGDMLVKVDRTSMLNSLECRAPFLNKKIWNYTNHLPSDYLISGLDKKHILKEAFKKDFPEEFLNKSKAGFGVPVGDWLRVSLRKDLERCIDDTLLRNQNIFNADAIKKLVLEHLKGKDHTFMVWSFYCFQKWYLENYHSN